MNNSNFQQHNYASKKYHIEKKSSDVYSFSKILARKIKFVNWLVNGSSGSTEANNYENDLSFSQNAINDILSFSSTENFEVPKYYKRTNNNNAEENTLSLSEWLLNDPLDSKTMFNDESPINYFVSKDEIKEYKFAIAPSESVSEIVYNTTSSITPFKPELLAMKSHITSIFEIEEEDNVIVEEMGEVLQSRHPYNKTESKSSRSNFLTKQMSSKSNFKIAESSPDFSIPGNKIDQGRVFLSAKERHRSITSEGSKTAVVGRMKRFETSLLYKWIEAEYNECVRRLRDLRDDDGDFKSTKSQYYMLHKMISRTRPHRCKLKKGRSKDFFLEFDWNLFCQWVFLKYSNCLNCLDVKGSVHMGGEFKKRDFQTLKKIVQKEKTKRLRRCWGMFIEEIYTGSRLEKRIARSLFHCQHDLQDFSNQLSLKGNSVKNVQGYNTSYKCCDGDSTLGIICDKMTSEGRESETDESEISDENKSEFKGPSSRINKEKYMTLYKEKKRKKNQLGSKEDEALENRVSPEEMHYGIYSADDDSISEVLYGCSNRLDAKDGDEYERKIVKEKDFNDEYIDQKEVEKLYKNEPLVAFNILEGDRKEIFGNFDEISENGNEESKYRDESQNEPNRNKPNNDPIEKDTDKNDLQFFQVHGERLGENFREGDNSITTSHPITDKLNLVMLGDEKLHSPLLDSVTAKSRSVSIDSFENDDIHRTDEGANKLVMPKTPPLKYSLQKDNSTFHEVVTEKYAKCMEIKHGMGDCATGTSFKNRDYNLLKEILKNQRSKCFGRGSDRHFFELCIDHVYRGSLLEKLIRDSLYSCTNVDNKTTQKKRAFSVKNDQKRNDVKSSQRSKRRSKAQNETHFQRTKKFENSAFFREISSLYAECMNAHNIPCTVQNTKIFKNRDYDILQKILKKQRMKTLCKDSKRHPIGLYTSHLYKGSPLEKRISEKRRQCNHVEGKVTPKIRFSRNTASEDYVFNSNTNMNLSNNTMGSGMADVCLLREGSQLIKRKQTNNEQYETVKNVLKEIDEDRNISMELYTSSFDEKYKGDDLPKRFYEGLETISLDVSSNRLERTFEVSIGLSSSQPQVSYSSKNSELSKGFEKKSFEIRNSSSIKDYNERQINDQSSRTDAIKTPKDLSIIESQKHIQNQSCSNKFGSTRLVIDYNKKGIERTLELDLFHSWKVDKRDTNNFDEKFNDDIVEISVSQGNKDTPDVDLKGSTMIPLQPEKVSPQIISVNDNFIDKNNVSAKPLNKFINLDLEYEEGNVKEEKDKSSVKKNENENLIQVSVNFGENDQGSYGKNETSSLKVVSEKRETNQIENLIGIPKNGKEMEVVVTMYCNSSDDESGGNVKNKENLTYSQVPDYSHKNDEETTDGLQKIKKESRQNISEIGKKIEESAKQNEIEQSPLRGSREELFEDGLTYGRNGHVEDRAKENDNDIRKEFLEIERDENTCVEKTARDSTKDFLGINHETSLVNDEMFLVADLNKESSQRKMENIIKDQLSEKTNKDEPQFIDGIHKSGHSSSPSNVISQQEVSKRDEVSRPLGPYSQKSCEENDKGSLLTFPQTYQLTQHANEDFHPGNENVGKISDRVYNANCEVNITRQSSPLEDIRTGTNSLHLIEESRPSGQEKEWLIVGDNVANIEIHISHTESPVTCSNMSAQSFEINDEYQPTNQYSEANTEKSKISPLTSAPHAHEDSVKVKNIDKRMNNEIPFEGTDKSLSIKSFLTCENIFEITLDIERINTACKQPTIEIQFTSQACHVETPRIHPEEPSISKQYPQEAVKEAQERLVKRSEESSFNKPKELAKEAYSADRNSDKIKDYELKEADKGYETTYLATHIMQEKIHLVNGESDQEIPYAKISSKKVEDGRYHIQNTSKRSFLTSSEAISQAMRLAVEGQSDEENAKSSKPLSKRPEVAKPLNEETYLLNGNVNKSSEKSHSSERISRVIPPSLHSLIARNHDEGRSIKGVEESTAFNKHQTGGLQSQSTIQNIVPPNKEFADTIQDPYLKGNTSSVLGHIGYQRSKGSQTITQVAQSELKEPQQSNEIHKTSSPAATECPKISIEVLYLNDESTPRILGPHEIISVENPVDVPSDSQGEARHTGRHSRGSNSPINDNLLLSVSFDGSSLRNIPSPSSVKWESRSNVSVTPFSVSIDIVQDSVDCHISSHDITSKSKEEHKKTNTHSVSLGSSLGPNSEQKNHDSSRAVYKEMEASSFTSLVIVNHAHRGIVSPQGPGSKKELLVQCVFPIIDDSVLTNVNSYKASGIITHEHDPIEKRTNLNTSDQHEQSIDMAKEFVEISVASNEKSVKANYVRGSCSSTSSTDDNARNLLIESLEKKELDFDSQLLTRDEPGVVDSLFTLKKEPNEVIKDQSTIEGWTSRLDIVLKQVMLNSQFTS